jgi:hypothetical protein
MGGLIDDQQETKRLLAAPTRSLHYELGKAAESLTGIDVNPVAIEIMRSAVPGRYIVVDIMNASLPDHVENELFEVIIFSDVIEHSDNFGWGPTKSCQSARPWWNNRNFHSQRVLLWRVRQNAVLVRMDQGGSYLLFQLSDLEADARNERIAHRRFCVL